MAHWHKSNEHFYRMHAYPYKMKVFTWIQTLTWYYQLLDTVIIHEIECCKYIYRNIKHIKRSIRLEIPTGRSFIPNYMIHACLLLWGRWFEILKKCLFFSQLILSHGSKFVSSFMFVQVQCTLKWSFVVFFFVSLYTEVDPWTDFFPKKKTILFFVFFYSIRLFSSWCHFAVSFSTEKFFCFSYNYNWFLKFFSIVLVFVFSAETWIGTALQSVHWIPTNWYLHQAKEKETANIKGPSNANVIR